jgi:hypothetical protein
MMFLPDSQMENFPEFQTELKTLVKPSYWVKTTPIQSGIVDVTLPSKRSQLKHELALESQQIVCSFIGKLCGFFIVKKISF